MPEIPVDIDALPSKRETLDETLTYRVMIRSLKVVGPDKNGNDYLTAETEVLEPEEFRGRRLYDSYIAIPSIKGGMSPQEKKKEEDKGIRLKNLISCFKVKFDSKGFNTENAVGCEGMVTVKNEEYPVGSGDLISKIGKYLSN